MEKKKDWIVDNLHIKEGGLEDLLFEYADAVIEDYQEKIEGDETLTSVPVARKIDEEVYNLVQAELDRAREEGIAIGLNASKTEIENLIKRLILEQVSKLNKKK